MKLLRYGGASVVTTVVTLVLLGVLLIRVQVLWANVIAVALGSAVSFELNRRWVWRHSGSRGCWARFLPFIAMSLGFLLVSGVGAREVGDLVASHHRGVRAFFVEGSTVGVFGLRWVAQYVFLQKFLFKTAPRRL